MFYKEQLHTSWSHGEFIFQWGKEFDCHELHEWPQKVLDLSLTISLQQKKRLLLRYDKQSLPLILNIKWYFSMTKPGTRWRWELPVQYSGEGEGGEEEGQCPSPNCWPGRTEGCWPGQAWSAPVLASGRQDVGWRVRRGGVRVSTEFLRAFGDLSQPATSYWGGGCSSPLWAKGFFDKSKWDGSKNVCLY